MINSKKPMFPITYGDIQTDSDLRISDKVVEVLENKRFQQASKQFGQLITGTILAEVPNSGLHWNLFAQAIVDTRSLHFWVLSSTNPQDFIIRFFQYAALETIGISFGHLKNGAGAIVIGGFRNFVAQELAPTILYNST